MDALRTSLAKFVAALVLVLAAAPQTHAASHRTTNFIVSAPTQAFAIQVAEEAERFRRELAIEWLGEELPQWQAPCPIQLQVGEHLGAGGATSFMFQGNTPYGWRMTIQGSEERILDSVLPHEVNHTIFATYFGRPLPRWADEGACTTVEAASERARQDRMLIEFLTTSRGIAFNRMFAMTEYPSDIMPLYSQGYSLARFLIAQGGKRKFVQYIGDGMNSGDWEAATNRHYAMEDLSVLQVTWLEWVRQGSPNLEADPANTLIASTENQPAGERGEGQMVPVHLASATSESNHNYSEQAASSTGSWYSSHRDREQASVEGSIVPSSTESIASVNSLPVGSDVSSNGTTTPNNHLQWVSPRRASAAGTSSLAQGEASQEDQATARPQMPQPAQPRVIEWIQPASTRENAGSTSP